MCVSVLPVVCTTEEDLHSVVETFGDNKVLCEPLASVKHKTIKMSSVPSLTGLYSTSTVRNNMGHVEIDHGFANMASFLAVTYRTTIWQSWNQLLWRTTETYASCE